MSMITSVTAHQHAALEKLHVILQQNLDELPDSTSAQAVEIPGREVAPIASQSNVLEKVSAQLSEFLKNHDNQLHFNLDQETGDLVISVVNQQTKEVIHQIPIDQLTLTHAQVRELNNLFYHVQV